jgi:hypothetical protein
VEHHFASRHHYLSHLDYLIRSHPTEQWRVSETEGGKGELSKLLTSRGLLDGVAAAALSFSAFAMADVDASALVRLGLACGV